VTLDLYADEHLRLRDGTAVSLRAFGRDRDAAALDDERAEIAAEDADGRTVGRVVYARVYGPRAEVALKVDDGFWHRGLPEALLERICARAACLGISTFLVRVRASDVRLLALLRHEFGARESRDGRHVDVEFSTALRPAIRVNHQA
jgi:GNAT superfamily N-acetyltransferase